MHEYRFLNAAPGAAPWPPVELAAATEVAVAPPRERSRRLIIQSVGLVLAGLLVGVLIVSALTHSSPSEQPAALNQTAVPPAAITVDPPQTQAQPPAGTFATDRVVGQITAVGSGNITLSRLDGSDPTRLAVTSDTVIVKGGVRVPLAALAVGDVAAVELSGTTAQTVVVGGRVGPGDGGGFGGPGDGDDGGGTTSGPQPGASPVGTGT